MTNNFDKSQYQEYENYKFIITEMRKQYFFKTLRYIAALLFTASLAIAFHSYTPCWFLLILLLFV